MNSTNAPYPDKLIINKDFSNKIKYPIIPLPEIDKLVKSSILSLDSSVLAIDSNNSGYDGGSTIKNGLLTPISPSDGPQLIKKASQLDVNLNTNLVEAKSKLSFWNIYNYCSRLFNSGLISISKFNNEIQALLTRATFESPTNKCDVELPDLPHKLLYTPIYFNKKYSLGLYLDNKYFHFESKPCQSF